MSLCGHHQRSVRARRNSWRCAGSDFGVRLASQLLLGRSSRSWSETREAEQESGDLGSVWGSEEGMLSEPPARRVRGWEPLERAHGKSAWAAWVQLCLGCLRWCGEPGVADSLAGVGVAWVVSCGTGRAQPFSFGWGWVQLVLARLLPRLMSAVMGCWIRLNLLGLAGMLSRCSIFLPCSFL